MVKGFNFNLTKIRSVIVHLSDIENNEFSTYSIPLKCILPFLHLTLSHYVESVEHQLSRYVKCQN